MGGREQLFYFPALGGSGSTESSISGQHVPLLVLAQQPDCDSGREREPWGHDFPVASLRTLNSFTFGTPSPSTTCVTHYLYHIKSPLKYREYFPLSWLDTGCYTDTTRPRQTNKAAWAHIHTWSKAYMQSFLEL